MDAAVRHHAEGKDRKLQQCATTEEVDDIVDATARNIGVQTLLRHFRGKRLARG